MLFFCGEIFAEPTFELPPYPVETTQASGLGLQPLSLGGLVIADAGSANLSAVDAFRDSLALRVRSFLGGNNEITFRFRSFGSQNVPSTRSLDFLLDGTPLGWSDGTGYFAALPATFLETAQAKPNGGATLGTLSMGGVVSISGAADAGDAGSFTFTVAEDDTAAASLYSALRLNPKASFRVNAATETSGGARPNNAVDRHALWLRQSIRLGEGSSVSLHCLVIEHRHEVPGPLNPLQAAGDPGSVSSGPVPGINAGFNIPRDRPRRDLTLWQCAATMQSRLQAAVLDVRAWMTGIADRFLRPVGFGGEHGKGFDSGFRSTVAFAGGHSEWRMEAGARYGKLETDLRHNEYGEWGSLWARHAHHAAAYHFGAECSTRLSAQLQIGVLGQIRHQRAWAEDLWDAATFPTFSAIGPAAPSQPHVPFRYDSTETHPTGALWLRYEPNAEQSLQFQASYSVELPVYSDRRTVYGGNPNRGPSGVTANPLRPQIARSIELSHSLRTELFDTQLNVYANHLSGEILRGRDSSGADWALNTPATRHVGVEAMLSTRLVSASGTWRGSVSGWFTDARFHEHPVHGNGPIAGVPKSEFQTMLRWTSASGELSLGSAINWLPEGMQVDNADTDTSPGYTLLHLSLRWAITPDWEVTASCRNVLDRHHVTAVIVREQVAAPIQANYLPGTGRKVSLSIRREW